MKYCPYCQQMVKPTKKINWIIFLILFLCFGIGVLYLLYCLFLKSPQCPICGGSKFFDTPEGNKQTLNDVIRNSSVKLVKKGINKIKKD